MDMRTAKMIQKTNDKAYNRGVNDTIDLIIAMFCGRIEGDSEFCNSIEKLKRKED